MTTDTMDHGTDFGPSLHGFSTTDWIDEVEELVAYDGYLERLGRRHLAAYTQHGPTLLVTFETLQGIQALCPRAHPLGWEMVRTQGWSSLALISDGDTWFRDEAVYAYFDRLVDDGFFDEFDSVLFYGAGPCGYAAAAFSVVSPGTRVLALQPQATLAPHLTEWDRRFPEQRRQDFTSRYGYAPDMLEAAAQAFVVYDPNELEDAIHAALYRRSNAICLPLRNMGTGLQTDMLQMGILYDLIVMAATGQMSRARFGKLMRARRNHPTFLRRLLARTERQERKDLTLMLCRNVTARMPAPRFAKRLKELEAEARAAEPLDA